MMRKTLRDRNSLKGDQDGQAVIIAVLFFLIGSLILMLAIVAPIARDVASISDLQQSKVSFHLSEGAIEDAVYRVRNDLTLPSPETLLLGEGTAITSTVDISDTVKEITAVADKQNLIRKTKVTMISTGSDNYTLPYVVHVGTGELTMGGNASVEGDIYANSPIHGNASPLSVVVGEVISAGPSGLIDRVDVATDGTNLFNARAHSITNSLILSGGNAYYWSDFSGSLVAPGSEFSGSADQPEIALPISDVQIEGWKTDAEAGGIISSCPYVLGQDDVVTLGPVKIDCNTAIFQNNANVTLTGNVWFTGQQLTMQDNVTVQVNAAAGDKSYIIIGDPENPLNRGTDGVFDISGSVIFSGSGNAGSNVILLSQNDSAENSGINKAVVADLDVGSSELMLYALHGRIDVLGLTEVRYVSGYEVHILENAEVIYDEDSATIMVEPASNSEFSLSNWGEVQ